MAARKCTTNTVTKNPTGDCTQGNRILIGLSFSTDPSAAFLVLVCSGFCEESRLKDALKNLDAIALGLHGDSSGAVDRGTGDSRTGLASPTISSEANRRRMEPRKRSEETWSRVTQAWDRLGYPEP